MLTLKNIKADQARNYYGESCCGKARWFGRAAAHFKLRGEIDRLAYRNLLEGRSPSGRKRLLGRKVDIEKHRAAIDCCFSAPKGVSLQALMVGDERLIEAHRWAVEVSLRMMESEYAETRISTGGRSRVVSTGNLAIAVFDHIETRTLDPHLHTHCVVLNVTRRPDGKWRGLHNDDIYRNRKGFDTIYREALAVEAQRLGYRIVETGNGQFDLAGYQEKVVKRFSNRREAILELAGVGAGPLDREIAWEITRPKKVHFSLEQLREIWLEEALRADITLPPIPYKLSNLEKMWLEEAEEFPHAEGAALLTALPSIPPEPSSLEGLQAIADAAPEQVEAIEPELSEIGFEELELEEEDQWEL